MRKTLLAMGLAVFLAAPAPALDVGGLIKQKLKVTVVGLGTVTSNPSGINCVNGAGDCSHEFSFGALVALLASPPPPDESGSYFFIEWSGDASGTLPVAAVLMDSDEKVTAQFGALGVPVFAAPVPTAPSGVYHHPVFSPLKAPALEDCRPLAIHEDPGTARVTVGLPLFSGPVDVYVGLTLDGLSDMVVFGPAAPQLLSDGLIAWRTNHLAQPDASLFGDLAGMLLPEGTYRLFLMVTPAGDVTRNFVWETYFEITHAVALDPFAPP